MTTKGVIYMMKGPKDYIGQTIDPEQRYAQHLRRAGQLKYGLLGDAIEEHGPDAFEFIVLHECPTEDLDTMETHFIELYNTLAPDGYNVDKKGHVSREKIDKLKYIQKYGEGFMVKKPGYRYRYFVATSKDTRTKYAEAVDYIQNIDEYATVEKRYIRKLRDGYRVRVPDNKDKHFVAASQSDDEKYELASNYLKKLLAGEIESRKFPHVQGICKHRSGYRVQLPGHPWKSFSSVKCSQVENYNAALAYRNSLMGLEN